MLKNLLNAMLKNLLNVVLKNLLNVVVKQEYWKCRYLFQWTNILLRQSMQLRRTKCLVHSASAQALKHTTASNFLEFHDLPPNLLVRWAILAVPFDANIILMHMTPTEQKDMHPTMKGVCNMHRSSITNSHQSYNTIVLKWFFLMQSKAIFKTIHMPTKIMGLHFAGHCC